MENANFEISFNEIILHFDGCTLVDAEHEESPEEIMHGEDWFIDKSGKRIGVEIEEDDRHPYDKGDSTLYAHIRIEGKIVKSLEIFEYADGTLYLESGDGGE